MGANGEFDLDYSTGKFLIDDDGKFKICGDCCEVDVYPISNCAASPFGLSKYVLASEASPGDAWLHDFGDGNTVCAWVATGASIVSVNPLTTTIIAVADMTTSSTCHPDSYDPLVWPLGCCVSSVEVTIANFSGLNTTCQTVAASGSIRFRRYTSYTPPNGLVATLTVGGGLGAGAGDCQLGTSVAFDGPLADYYGVGANCSGSILISGSKATVLFIDVGIDKATGKIVAWGLNYGDPEGFGIQPLGSFLDAGSTYDLGDAIPGGGSGIVTTVGDMTVEVSV